MSLVNFVKIQQNAAEGTVAEALDLIDYRFRNDVKSIAIKPNMCYCWDYSTGHTTDPAFIGARANL